MFVGICTIKKPTAIINIPANFIPVNLVSVHCESITERYHKMNSPNVIAEKPYIYVYIYTSISLPADTGTDNKKLSVMKLSYVTATPKLASKFAPI